MKRGGDGISRRAKVSGMRQGLSVILAAVDFSAPSELALRRAARLAQEHRARLALVHVVDTREAGRPRALTRTGALFRALLKEIGRRLKQTAAALSKVHGIRTSIALERGIPAQRIARAASRLKADLIVVGAHGEHTLLDAVLGTTAQRVLHLAKQPVLVVRGRASGPHREVLLPCDDSPASQAAARFARVAFPRAHYTLANVANVPFEGFLSISGAGPRTIARYREDFRQRAETRLTRLAAEAGIGEDCSICVTRGYVPAQISRMASDLRCGVIVMGAHGAAPLADRLLGSVSAHVVAEALCDVLLVKGGEPVGTRRRARRGRRTRVKR